MRRKKKEGIDTELYLRVKKLSHFLNSLSQKGANTEMGLFHTNETYRMTPIIFPESVATKEEVEMEFHSLPCK